MRVAVLYVALREGVAAERIERHYRRAVGEIFRPRFRVSYSLALKPREIPRAYSSGCSSTQRTVRR